MRARAGGEWAPAPVLVSQGGVGGGASLIGQLGGGRPPGLLVLLLGGPAPGMVPRRSDLPVSAHIARPDPFDDEQLFTEWAGEAGGVDLELHRYDGVGHYFLDRSLPDYNAEAAALCLDRCRAFLGRF